MIVLPFIYMLLFGFMTATPYISYFRDSEASAPFLVAVSVLYVVSLAVFLVNKKAAKKVKSLAVILYVVVLAVTAVAGALVRGLACGRIWGIAWGVFSIFFPLCFLLFLYFAARVKSGWDNMV